MNLKPIGSNMTELRICIGGNDATVLFSYQTPVAACIAGEGWFRTEKKWSVTTSKHINKWLNCIHAQKRPQEFFDNLIANKGA